MNRIFFAFLPALILLFQIGQAGAQESERHARLMDRLIAAYPDFLLARKGNLLIWKDGTEMPFDDGRTKTFDERMNDPDLEDMFYASYQAGRPAGSPGHNIDPGRIRYEPFFKRMYGANRAQVRANLKRIVWLPEKSGKKIKVMAINGIAEKLQKISLELDRLPKRFNKYLIPMRKSDRKFVPGIFNWRCIRGTQRLSVHSFGAAIDLVFLQYWQTAFRPGGKKQKGSTNCSAKQPRFLHKHAKGKGHRHAYKNSMPMEIVDIFERHGFIWGGKWYHYDTMHFEYRPELLSGGQ